MRSGAEGGAKSNHGLESAAAQTAYTSAIMRRIIVSRAVALLQAAARAAARLGAVSAIIEPITQCRQQGLQLDAKAPSVASGVQF